MSLPRNSAEKLNPIIGNTPADTYHNISGVFGLIQDLSIHEAEMHLSKGATVGLYNLIECAQAALSYEEAERKR